MAVNNALFNHNDRSNIANGYGEKATDAQVVVFSMK
jgi:hypothetical protein